MNLSIIIPTLNEELYIERLLSSLRTQTLDGKLQIIVSDGNSNDKTKNIVNKFYRDFTDITFIENTKRGVAKQRNAGAKNAKYEYILFLDADMLLPPNFLKKLELRVHKLKNKNIIALATHLPTTKNIFDWLFTFIVMGYVSAMKFIKPVCAGSFLLTTRSIHKNINGFNETIFIAEDIDYGNRAIKSKAIYHIFYNLFIYASPRRLYSTGRTRLLWKWMIGHFYTIFFGPIRNDSLFHYEFGKHDKVL